MVRMQSLAPQTSVQKVVIALAGVIVLSGCATTQHIEERAGVAELPPMEKLRYEEGDSLVQMDLKNDKEVTIVISEVAENGAYRGTSTTGCSWTNDGDFFSPSSSWDNCGTSPNWNKGRTQQVSSEGTLWPLEVGNKASWKVTDYSNITGEKGSTGTRNCEVKSVVNITVAMGDIDAYKVVCSRDYGNRVVTRTWYMNPELGEVKFLRKRSDKGLSSNREMLRKESI